MSALCDDLTELLQLLVDEPEEVRVFQSDGPRSARFEVSVAREDLGKVIGRQGRAVRAVRSLLAARGELDRKRYELEILED